MSAPSNGADLTIEERFRGPAKSGNGGYTAGSLAERLLAGRDPVAVEVTLRLPPPLGVPMQVEHDASVTRLVADGRTVAEGRAVDLDIDPVEAVDRDAAAATASGFPGLRSHPFPTCFGCGPDRTEGDGLRIFPGPVGDGRMAALWTPDRSLGEQTPLSDLPDQTPRAGIGTTWAALDCIGGWSADMEGRKMVLGRMTAQVDALPAVGEPHLVIARSLGQEGRKTFTASTLYDADERIVARARHVWIEIDPAAFN